MFRLILASILTLAIAAPALAKDKPQIHDPAPLRYGMEQDEAEKVIADAAMWKVAYRVDTETTTEFACAWSGSVFYHVRFLQGKCCYIEKRAEVGPEDVDQLIQMYRAVYGDSPEATSSRNGTLIFSRWQLPEREITISAVGRSGRYKLFYEEYDPVQVGDVRVAQERELGDNAETDPLTGKLRISPLGQSATTDEGTQEQAEEESAVSGDDESAEASADEEDAAPSDEDKPKKEKRKRQPKDDPVTGDRG